MTNLEYRQKLVDNSKIKWLSKIWYLGTTKYWHGYIEYEKDGQFFSKEFDQDYDCKLYSRPVLYSLCLAKFGIDDNNVKKFVTKKRRKVTNVENSLKNKIEYKFFVHKMNKIEKRGLELRGTKYCVGKPSKTFNKLKILNLAFYLFPTSHFKLWDCDDIYSILIIKLTITALALKKFASSDNKNTVRQMWAARNILLKLSNLSNYEKKIVENEVKLKFGIHNIYSTLVMMDIDQFLATGNVVTNKKNKNFSSYSLRFNPHAIARGLNLPLDTESDKKIVLQKEEEITKFVIKMSEDLKKNHDNVVKSLWNKASELLSNIEYWSDY